jgi:hypothetical protein
MTEITTHQFPYGTFFVDSSVRHRYNNAPLSRTYPLPDTLPMHHPLLQQLEGVYPVVDTLPPWWSTVVERCDLALKPLVQEVTIREWRSGVLDDKRWRAWKEQMSPQELDRLLNTSVGNSLLHRPKLAALFSGVETYWFEGRGPKDTPQELDLVISFRPEYLLNMSNGRGWTNCQDLYEGNEHECLHGNWYDTGVAVALIVPRGADIWQGAEREREGVVLARTILRVFHFDDHTLGVVIGGFCDNNKTLEVLLFSRLLSLFQDQGLSWGSMYCLTRLQQSCFIGSLREEEQELHSIAFWRPSGVGLPYIDDTSRWEYTDDDCTFLTANILRWYLLNNSGREKLMIRLKTGLKRFLHSMISPLRPLYPELLRGYLRWLP